MHANVLSVCVFVCVVCTCDKHISFCTPLQPQLKERKVLPEYTKLAAAVLDFEAHLVCIFFLCNASALCKVIFVV